MVDKLQTDNSANKHMHYEKPLNVGILNPPDRLPKVVVYSKADADFRYKVMQNDIYESYKKAAEPPKKGFPTILKIIGGVVATTGAIIFRKDIAKFFKRLFRL